MKIGAHVSTAGGLDKAIDRAQAIGANTIQIFGSQPQSWRQRNYDQAQLEAFRNKAAAATVAPVFLHGIYLINLATANPENLARSQESLVHDLGIAAQLGTTGVIFHVGSHRGAGYDQVFAQVVNAIRNVLDRSPADVWLILENSAGMGESIGSRFGELGTIIREVGDQRLKVCLDTQHSFAAGYDVATAQGLEATLAEFDREVGLPLLVTIHANDSKVALGGGMDRHENIGQGYIGREGFAVILNHPALRRIPFLLEVPGFANEGPDKENVDILRSLAGDDPT